MAKKLTIEERVQRGVKWLDKKGPENWRSKVEINELDLSSACRCVLGQVFETVVEDDSPDTVDPDSYSYGPYKVNGWDYVMDYVHDKIGFRRVVNNPTSFGFDADFKATGGLDEWGEPIKGDYEELTAEWKRVLGR